MSTHTTTHIDPPHPEIELVAGQVIELYKRQRRYLQSKDTNYISDLLAATLDVAKDADYSRRVGAEVNKAAATMLLEERGRK